MNYLLRNALYLISLAAQKPMLALRKSTVDLTTKIKSNATLVRTCIGKYCYVGGEAYLIDTIVGNYCSIASGVKIGGMEHSWWWASTSSFLSDYNVCKKTVIEDDVWIGVNAVVKQGLTIGRGSVVGAGAVVLQDVAAYSIVAGVPSKQIRMRFPPNTIDKLNETRYWLDTPAVAKIKLSKLDAHNYFKKPRE